MRQSAAAANLQAANAAPSHVGRICRRAFVAVAWAGSLGFSCPWDSPFDRATAQRLLDKEVADVVAVAHASDAKKEYITRKWHATPELGDFDPSEVIRPPVQVTGVANGPGDGLGALLAAGAEKSATFTTSTIASHADGRRHQVGGVAYFKKYDDGWRIEAILLNSAH